MNKIAKTIRFPKELEAKITEYQKRNELSTFTTAVMELIRRGLDK